MFCLFCALCLRCNGTKNLWTKTTEYNFGIVVTTVKVEEEVFANKLIRVLHDLCFFDYSKKIQFLFYCED